MPPLDQPVQMTLPHSGVKPTAIQEFDLWKTSKGGNWVLEQCHRYAARFAEQYLKTGRKVSINLIWGMVRYYELKGLLEQHALERTDGYVMNDHFAPLVARHILDRHPDWAGMFETRQLQKPRRPSTEIVVKKYAA